MKAPARLGLYGLVLVTVFGVSAITANTVIPEDTVQAWADETEDNTHHGQGDADMNGEHEGHEAGAASLGLSLAEDGYQLTNVTAPADTGSEGEMAFAVTGPEGQAVTDFELDHEQEMHLIVVRGDGQHFRHVHPELNADGTWSIPWEWEAAGTYRVFADFVPGETGEGLTLSTTVQVSGDYESMAAEPAAETRVDGFDVSLTGSLVAGEAAELTITISQGGEPVMALEPYLGAFGHLVALRDGDLAYLHIHPHGDAPEAGETSGPEIVFEATAPTEGRYLLFLDFQVDGEVHTAPLVIHATIGSDTGQSHDNTEEGEDHEH